MRFCVFNMQPVPDRHRDSLEETIGQRLKRLRRERGLSQRELASPGVSYAYISRIEGGARRPSVKALRMLARKLGVTADYLETGSEIRDTEEDLADEKERAKATEYKAKETGLSGATPITDGTNVYIVLANGIVRAIDHASRA